MESIQKLMSFALLLLCMSKIAVAKPNEVHDISGSWQGALSISGQSLPLIFHINHDLTATMDSPAQGANHIPIKSVTIEEQKVIITVEVAQATFVGKLDSKNNSIEGHWNQGPNKLPLSLKKAKKELRSQINRPQHPSPPFQYLVEEVKFQNHEQNIELAGTLTLPSSTGEFPAVVLITGSGPQDRDQTFMGHKTFLVIADHFTRHGIAVLRFDDRGVGLSSGDFTTATSADFAQDVSAAVDFLAFHNNISKDNIGLIGHSEGGLIAPITANENSNVSFITLLAGPGQTGNDISIWQIKTILHANGLSLEAATAGSEITRALNSAVINNANKDTLESELLSTYDMKWQALPDAIKAEIRAIGGGNLPKARIEVLSTNWTKYFLKHNPMTYLENLDIPVLAIHGDKDTQMDMNLNLSKIRHALQQHSHPLSKVEKISGVNHLFQRADSGLMSEYSQIEETMSPAVLQMLSSWVLKVSSENK